MHLRRDEFADDDFQNPCFPRLRQNQPLRESEQIQSRSITCAKRTMGGVILCMYLGLTVSTAHGAPHMLIPIDSHLTYHATNLAVMSGAGAKPT